MLHHVYTDDSVGCHGVDYKRHAKRWTSNSTKIWVHMDVCV